MCGYVVKQVFVVTLETRSGRHLSFITGALQHAGLYPNPAGQWPNDEWIAFMENTFLFLVS